MVQTAHWPPMSMAAETKPIQTLRSFLVCTSRNARRSEQYCLCRPLLLALPVVTDQDENKRVVTYLMYQTVDRHEFWMYFTAAVTLYLQNAEVRKQV